MSKTQDLEIVKLCDRMGKDKIKNFGNELNSKLRVQTETKKVIKDTEWIDVIEETLPYIDNILRNPNRFIISDDEIVKVELAKKITVNSIKHLAKHTDMIQTIDEETGDIVPAKILNSNKEETYETYENKLIYTLIQNCKVFIKLKKAIILGKIKATSKDNKNIEYNAETNIKDEKVNVMMTLNSSANKQNSEQEENEELLDKIETLEKKINEITLCSEVYKTIEKLHINLLRDPIKKTNVILKNTNFQYAMKLWEYLKRNYDDKTAEIEDSKDYQDEGELKELMDETFLLQYVALQTLEQDEEENHETRSQIKNAAVSSLIDKLLDMDIDLTDEQLKELVSSQYETIKYKKILAIQEIQKIFKTHIDKYIKNVENME